MYSPDASLPEFYSVSSFFHLNSAICNRHRLEQDYALYLQTFSFTSHLTILHLQDNGTLARGHLSISTQKNLMYAPPLLFVESLLLFSRIFFIHVSTILVARVFNAGKETWNHTNTHMGNFIVQVPTWTDCRFWLMQKFKTVPKREMSACA